MEEIPEIRLHIGDHIFTVKKNILCEHSDYFQAMFSGSYVENDQRDITIDVDAVDANAMSIILRYFELGLIDLNEYDLPVISCLATAASFLQITELGKQIEYCLDILLTHSNWVEIMSIAQKAVYGKLEKLSAAYGLLNFKTMKVEYIPTVEKLFWYLSHPYLDNDNEMDVFTFGLQWMLSNETGADAIIIILGCLDMKRVTTEDLEEIRDAIMMQYTPHSLAFKVAECLVNIRGSKVLSESNVILLKDSLRDCFNEKVFVEVLHLVKESRERSLSYTPTITLYNPKQGEMDNDGPHFLYKMSKDNGFEKWLEVGSKHFWGFSVASWGLTKVVVVGGEYGRGTGLFMRDVKVFDILKEEWTTHGVELPKRRHGSVAILGDTMFFIGGVGAYRIVLDTGIAYDMKLKSYRMIANLPGPVQSPAICAHKGDIYASVEHEHINKYSFEGSEHNGSWFPVCRTDIQYDKMTSFKDYIYCTQNHFCDLFRFKPGVDKELHEIETFNSPTAALCGLKDRIIIITRPTIMEDSTIEVEELQETDISSFETITWQHTTQSFRHDDLSSCAFVFDIPHKHDFSSYHLKYLKDRIIIITRPTIMEDSTIEVEELQETDISSFETITWQHTTQSFRHDDLSSCAFVFDIPHKHDFSSYHLKYLSQYKYL